MTPIVSMIVAHTKLLVEKSSMCMRLLTMSNFPARSTSDPGSHRHSHIVLPAHSNIVGVNIKASATEVSRGTAKRKLVVRTRLPVWLLVVNTSAELSRWKIRVTHDAAAHPQEG